jgi:hypothetical protein
MYNYMAIIVSLFCIGSIDVIEGHMAHVVITTDGPDTYEADIPVELFPCEIAEGDLFYAQIVDGVTEIRCGEPDAE